MSPSNSNTHTLALPRTSPEKVLQVTEPGVHLTVAARGRNPSGSPRVQKGGAGRPRPQLPSLPFPQDFSAPPLGTHAASGSLHWLERAAHCVPPLTAWTPAFIKLAQLDTRARIPSRCPAPCWMLGIHRAQDRVLGLKELVVRGPGWGDEPAKRAGTARGR